MTYPSCSIAGARSALVADVSATVEVWSYAGAQQQDGCNAAERMRGVAALN
jgi:hypothetical protein